MILINYLLGYQTFSTPSWLSLTAPLLLPRIHIVSTMDIKRHSTFFFCKPLLIFINCFLPPNALHFGPNINLLDTESISVSSPVSHLLLHLQTISRPPPSLPVRSTYPLLPRSSIIPILHLIYNPSFALYCHYLLPPYCLLKPPFGLGGVIPPVQINLLLLLITTTCYNANSATPNLYNASSLVFLGNGCFHTFHPSLHRILLSMTPLCLFPSFYCHVFSHNMTYYSPPLIDPSRGLSSLLLPLIHGTNVAMPLLKSHAIPVLFAPLPVTSVKLLQT